MTLGESIVDYLSRVRGIAQQMQGVTIDRIIPFFGITSIDHKRYPGVKSRYLAGNTALVNFDLLQLGGLLLSEETRQSALGIPAIPRPPLELIVYLIHKIILRMNAPPHSHINPQ